MLPLIMVILVLIFNLIHIKFESDLNLTKFSVDQFGLNEPFWLKYIVKGIPFLSISGPAILTLFLPSYSALLWSIAGIGFLGDLLFTHIGGSLFLKNRVPGTNIYTYVVYTLAGLGILFGVGIHGPITFISALPFFVYWPGFYIFTRIKNAYNKR